MAAEAVRFGVAGLGAMGGFHLSYLPDVPGAKIAAVCDAFGDKAHTTAEALTQRLSTPVRAFIDPREMLSSGAIDAVLIATPHYQHPEIALAAFDAGVHVLCEKPLAVGVKDGRRVIEAHGKVPNLKFALMLQMRTVSLYRKLRSLIHDGDLGEVTRLNWIVTDWFRTWTYYASGGWRATWAGEGGGALINQCPHNLDMIQWLVGMPSRVTAVVNLGAKHPIEVEDEVSAILEFPRGAIGQFSTSTGEAPGTNRLEIAGDRGKVVAENGKLTFFRTRKSVREIRETSPESFAQVETWEIDVPHKSSAAEGHQVVTRNFVDAILKDEPLLTPGSEGSKGLEIGNAILMAGVTRRPVDLPLDGDAYDQLLKDLAQQYGGRKTLAARQAVVDMGASFAKP